MIWSLRMDENRREWDFWLDSIKSWYADEKINGSISFRFKLIRWWSCRVMIVKWQCPIVKQCCWTETSESLPMALTRRWWRGTVGQNYRRKERRKISDADEWCFLIKFEFYDHRSQIWKPRGAGPTDVINLYRRRRCFHCVREVTFDVWITFSFFLLFRIIITRHWEVKLSMHTTGALSWLTSSISVFNISRKDYRARLPDVKSSENEAEEEEVEQSILFFEYEEALLPK